MDENLQMDRAPAIKQAPLIRAVLPKHRAFDQADALDAAGKNWQQGSWEREHGSRHAQEQHSSRRMWRRRTCNMSSWSWPCREVWECGR